MVIVFVRVALREQNRKRWPFAFHRQETCFPTPTKTMMSHATFILPDPVLFWPNTRPVPDTPPKRVEYKQGHARFTPSADEAEAIATLRAKEPEAMDRLVRDQYHRIYGTILRLVYDPDEAQSLVQETFLQAFRSLDTFRGHSKVSTWIYGIAMNVTRDHLRKKTRHRRVLSERHIDWLQPHFTWQGTHTERYTTWDPERMMEKRERVRLVREAIDQLPERYRVVLTMRDLDELSTTEVAEALSMSEGSVRVRLHRARNALRKLLAPHFARG